MSSKALGNLMRCSVLAAAVCGLFLCGYLIPSWGGELIGANPELSAWFWPWLSFAWAFALPCFVILVLIWRVAGLVAREAVFTMQTAKLVKTGALLLLGDIAFLLFGNVVLLFLDMNHPGVILIFGMGGIFAVALAVLAAVLSRYLAKAAVLQEESEATL